jgi:membrane protease subunit (stomatin/prohibitin family)
MGLFSNQFANVVEWEEYRDDLLFWKWTNREIKKDSKLIIKPGQDAIFLYNGAVEGIFTEDGSYTIDSQIIPFLSTLKGFKFGFNSGLRAEVLFVNTKEFTCNWGTSSPIRLQAPGLPGGLPVRSNGKFSFKISDYNTLIEKIAGVKNIFTVDDVRDRIKGILDGLLMKWITKVGGDVFNLMANATDISKGILEDLDMELIKLGLTMTDFRISEFTYPENISKRADQAAEYTMLGDMNRYQQVSMIDAMTSGKTGGKTSSNASDMASSMMGMQMGMMMANQMAGTMNNMMQNNQQNVQQNNQQASAPVSNGTAPKFCPNCGTPTTGTKFCANCGTQLM